MLRKYYRTNLFVLLIYSLQRIGSSLKVMIQTFDLWNKNIEAMHTPHFSYKSHMSYLALDVLTDTIYFPKFFIENIRLDYGMVKCSSLIKWVM